MPRWPNFVEPGTKFGKWTVIRFVENNSENHRLYEYKCDCGFIKISRLDDLKSGKSTQCVECYNKNNRSLIKKTHGLSRTKVYRIWNSLKNRCNNPNDKDYAYYGGRGIKVCDRWNKSFELFYEDIGKDKKDGMELDRIDNNGHYEPLNCHWVTHQTNCRNRRRSGPHRRSNPSQ